ncbi:serine/threonine protein phosphatase [Halobacteroides halobius DSM 5150]|uniref:Serine/threonine protein phosphatase n=1 Tax=Halobacteroides halobius (strain ATCC 35273 / DSM 5150 / MD-1) TaxID=748449 RepID=L0K934_HALHC|nr:Stp1/IreP family PP2C-type Ser/Thr phosphatase [Halobacteroides halobius]AGB40854.1 serine/threonine protein phosphatase [Halobacteroides halobius DSM 5150]
MSCGVRSERGKVRDKNEDNYLTMTTKDDLKVIAVADGMGGHQGGRIASSVAIEVVENYEFTKSNLKTDIDNCIKLANKKILQKANDNLKYNGMGTTLTLGIIKDKILIIGHVGDSRAYLYSENQLKQITNDHSYVNELVKKNIISSQEADKHPKRNLLTRALGTNQEVKVDIIELELKDKDLVLLCSDGATEMLSKQDLIKVINKNSTLQDKANKVVDMANQAGGYDNITVLFYQIK